MKEPTADRASFSPLSGGHRSWLACAACWALACVGPDPGRPAAAWVAVQQRGEVVARVGANALTSDDVRLESEYGASRDRAVVIERLIDELVLAREAEVSGFASAARTMRARRRALAQLSVAELVEERCPEEGVGDDEVRARYEAEGARFEHPEQRASVHLLAAPKDPNNLADDAAARAMAADALREAQGRNAQEYAIAFEVFRRRAAAEAQNVVIRIEQVPALTRADDAAKEYLDALFTPAALGPLPEPVRTSFGWHAIVVTKINPAAHRKLQDADVVAELRRTLAEECRAKQLKTLVEELRVRFPVVYDGARALEDLKLVSSRLAGSNPVHGNP